MMPTDHKHKTRVEKGQGLDYNHFEKIGPCRRNTCAVITPQKRGFPLWVEKLGVASFRPVSWDQGGVLPGNPGLSSVIARRRESQMFCSNRLVIRRNAC